MSGINAGAIERELDRIRSLDLKELRREGSANRNAFRTARSVIRATQ